MNLDQLIDLYDKMEAAEDRVSEDELSERSVAALRILSENLSDLSHRIAYEVFTNLGRTFEVQNFPDIANHLYEILLIKLRNEDDFIKISGLRLGTHDSRLYVTLPDLSPLGDFSDWESMQEAGHDLFETKGKAKSPEQKAAGWYYHYNNFVSDSKGSDVYPTIMRARLEWGIREELAPYWYWYDRTIDTKYATPIQQPINLVSIIRGVVREYASYINDRTSEVSDEIYIEIRIGNLSKEIEDKTDAWSEGRSGGPSKPEVGISYGGTYKGRTLTEGEIISLIKSGEIRISRSYTEPSGDIRVNFQVTGSRQFTGLYKKISRT
jgi:hypothetical protein